MFVSRENRVFDFTKRAMTVRSRSVYVCVCIYAGYGERRVRAVVGERSNVRFRCGEEEEKRERQLSGTPFVDTS